MADHNDLRNVFDRLPADKKDFAASLLTQFDTKGYLSEKQRFWVDKLHHTAVSPPPSRSISGDSFSTIANMFADASEKFRYPKIRLQIRSSLGDGRYDGWPVVLSRATSASKYPGSVNITDGGPYGENIWYGRISLEGIWTESDKVTDEVREIIRELNAAPAMVIAAYGKTTGCCSICARPLKDERSLHVGYGSTCASKMGLPWGDKS